MPLGAAQAAAGIVLGRRSPLGRASAQRWGARPGCTLPGRGERVTVAGLCYAHGARQAEGRATRPAQESPAIRRPFEPRFIALRRADSAKLFSGRKSAGFSGPRAAVFAAWAGPYRAARAGRVSAVSCGLQAVCFPALPAKSHVIPAAAHYTSLRHFSPSYGFCKTFVSSQRLFGSGSIRRCQAHLIGREHRRCLRL